jgi:hypothetical protein
MVSRTTAILNKASVSDWRRAHAGNPNICIEQNYNQERCLNTTTKICLNIKNSWRSSRHWWKRSSRSHSMIVENTSLLYQLTTMHTIEVVCGVRSAGERLTDTRGNSIAGYDLRDSDVIASASCDRNHLWTTTDRYCCTWGGRDNCAL